MTLYYKRIISFVMIFAVALATGFSVGKIYVDSKTAPTLNMEGSEAEFREDENVVKNLVNKSESQAVLSFSGIELFQIAEYKLQNSKNFMKESTGTVVSTGQTVFMRSQKISVGNDYVYYKLSPSKTVNLGVTKIETPQVCSKIAYNSKTKKITIVPNEKGVMKNTTAPETLDADFSAKPDVYTQDEYFEIFKTNPTTTLTYIVSEKTSKDCVSDVRDNGDGTYSFDINYKNNKGVINAAFYYAYEILFSSGYSLPYWDYVNLVVTVDSNFNFVSISYKEKYELNSSKIPVLGKATVVNDFTDKFYFEMADISQRALSDFKSVVEVA